MEQKQRPIILEIDEAKKELVECVNRILQTHKLPNKYIYDFKLKSLSLNSSFSFIFVIIFSIVVINVIAILTYYFLIITCFKVEFQYLIHN